MSEQDLHQAIVDEAIRIVQTLKEYGMRFPQLERLVNLVGSVCDSE